MSFRRILIYLAGAAALLSGCGLVDEKLGDCGADFEAQYELELVTNMTTEIQTQLSLAADISVATSLRSYLKGIFTDFAHDVDLSFYGVSADSLRLKHMSEVMNANQSSYTFYIPSRRYMHLAVANLLDNGSLSLVDSLRCHSSRLHQRVADTLPPHRTGLFTARLAMEVVDNQDQRFDVRLFMANCAAALVVDTLGSGLRDIRAVATGFATDFALCDSLYTFSHSPVFKADRLPVEGGTQLCFATVNFPSREPEDVKSIIETEDPFVSEGAESSLWQWRVYATLTDGTVVETRLGVLNPLRGGQLRIIKVQAQPSGSVQPGSSEMGVSVSIDWNYNDGFPEIDL